MGVPPAADKREHYEGDLYDLLDALIDRTAWRAQAEKARWHQLVAQHRMRNTLGTSASAVRVGEKR